MKLSRITAALAAALALTAGATSLQAQSRPSYSQLETALNVSQSPGSFTCSDWEGNYSIVTGSAARDGVSAVALKDASGFIDFSGSGTLTFWYRIDADGYLLADSDMDEEMDKDGPMAWTQATFNFSTPGDHFIIVGAENTYLDQVVWTPGTASSTVTVTYNVNGGNTLTPGSKTVTVGDTYGALPDPTRTGHTFAGWFTSETGGTQVTSGTTVTQTSNHTIWARWAAAGGAVHDFVFCLATGFTSEFFLSNTQTGKTPMTTFEQGEPIYLWYAFWDKNKVDFNSTMTNAFRVVINGTTYRLNHSINFSLPGGYLAGNFSQGSEWNALQNLAPGTYTVTATLNDGNTVPETDYSNNTRSITFTVTGTSPTTVTVTFNGNSGTPATQTLTQTVGDNYVLPSTNPTRTGYTFAGWFTDATGGTQVTSGTPASQTAAHTLWAHWTSASSLPTMAQLEAALNVSQSPGSFTCWDWYGTYSIVTGSAARDSVSAVALEEAGGFIEFSGPGKLTFWYRVGVGGYFWAGSDENEYEEILKEGVAAWTQATFNFSTPGDHCVGLDAYNAYLDQVVWTPANASSTVTVTFNGNGGTPASQTVTQTVGNRYVLPSANPTQAGYTFAGWFTSATGGTQVTTSTTVSQTTAHTLYARWTANGTPPPPSGDGSYLSDPEDMDGSAPRDSTAYDGFVYDEDNAVRGIITLSAKKDKKGDWTFSAKAVLQTATVSFSGKAQDAGRFNVTAKSGERLNVTVGSNRFYGTLSGGKAGGTLNVDGARAVFADKNGTAARMDLPKLTGLYNVVMADFCSDREGEEEGIFGYLSLNVGNAGVVKIAGQLKDGTKVSCGAKLLAGLNEDGWHAVTLYSPLYSKKGFIGGLLWIDPDSRMVFVDAGDGWYVNWLLDGKSEYRWNEMCIEGGWFSNGKTTPLVPRGLVFCANVTDDPPPMSSSYDSESWWEEVTDMPFVVPVIASGGKLSLPKGKAPKLVKEDGYACYTCSDIDDVNPHCATLSYTAKTGLFKGAFKLYYAWEDKNDKVNAKTVSASYTGLMVPDGEGGLVGYGMGSVTINKQKIGVAVWLEPGEG